MKLILKAHKFFHRVNRGIVLAVVLIFGLVIYLGVDAARFDTEKLAIKDMVTAYAKEAETLMILPEDVQIPGEGAPQEAVEQKINEDNEIFTKYLTRISVNRSVYLDAVMNIEGDFKYNDQMCAYVTECNYTVTDISKLRKCGPNLAIGDIILKTSLKTIGNPVYFKLLMSLDADAFNLPNRDIDVVTHSYSDEITYMDVIFKKIGNQWKIAQISGSSAPRLIYG
ncbi:MAG: hypothetical protein LBI03_03035 [Clostridiales bacterium]|nr:hypothetical protein [Clostridiales bacterium]